MKDAEQDGSGDLGQAIWERDEAFPKAGEGFGWMDRKGKRYAAGSMGELSRTIEEDRGCVINLVWTPESRYCRVPEEVEVFEKPIREIRQRWAADDVTGARGRMRWLGMGLLVFMGYLAISGFARGGDVELGERVGFFLNALSRSPVVGMVLVGFLIFAFIPWYQAEKRMREIAKAGGTYGVDGMVPLLRFEAWLGMQRAPVTWVLFVLMVGVAMVQMVHDRSLMVFQESVVDAGLVKNLYFAGEWWRLFTAPMMHGGVVHLVMNLLALLYLGKRVEVFARWPHVAMVFLFAALAGGEASARFMGTTSVGASGGLMGWLGFLLVFETLHARLVPRSARRRLLSGVVMTGLIGLVGYRFIDNAAHLGGLVAGMAYAVIVFPKSSSVMRPRMTVSDRVLGVVSLGVIGIAAGGAVLKILG